MSKPNKEKTWNDLTPQEIEHFYRLGSDRAKQISEFGHNLWMEFAKYLLAVNAGAAAGLFLLARSESDLLFIAFAFFCGGVFSVGCAFFANVSHCVDVALGWTKDFNSLMRSEITLGDLEDRNTRRLYRWKWKLGRFSMLASFICLLAGGCFAAKVFWVEKSVPKPEALAPARP